MKRIAFLTVIFVLMFAYAAWADDYVDDATVSVTVPTYHYWNDPMDNYVLTPAGAATNYADSTGLTDLISYFSNDVSWDMTASWAIGTLPAGTLEIDTATSTGYVAYGTALDRLNGAANYSETVNAVKYTISAANWLAVAPGTYSGTLTLTASDF